MQPPGILLLMSPVGVFSRVFGTHDGFIVARVVSSVVTALNAGLLAWLVRHRGRLAMVLAGGGLAFLPVSFFVSSSLTLEPYCVLFVLAGALVVLDRDATGRGGQYAALRGRRTAPWVRAPHQAVGHLSPRRARTVPRAEVSATRGDARERGRELFRCVRAALLRRGAAQLLLRGIRRAAVPTGGPDTGGQLSATDCW